MSEEKLRGLLAEARGWVFWAACEHGTASLGDGLVQRIDAALAEPVSDDYRRGAEVMREAAAKDCIDFWGAGHASGVMQAGRIRALPVPEDKP